MFDRVGSDGQAGAVDADFIDGRRIASGRLADRVERSHAGEVGGDGAARGGADVHRVRGLVVEGKAGKHQRWVAVRWCRYTAVVKVLRHALADGSRCGPIGQFHADGRRRTGGEVTGRRTGAGNGAGDDGGAGLLGGDLVIGGVDGSHLSVARGEGHEPDRRFTAGYRGERQPVRPLTPFTIGQRTSQVGDGGGGYRRRSAQKHLLAVLGVASFLVKLRHLRLRNALLRPDKRNGGDGRVNVHRNRIGGDRIRRGRNIGDRVRQSIR